MEALLGARKDLTLEQLGDDPEQVIAAAELQRKFFTKYRARLEATGIDVDARLAGLAQRRAEVLPTGHAYEKASEDYFQRMADEAEERTRKIEQIAGALGFFENQTEAEWAAFTPEEHENMKQLIARLRGELPRLLAHLPLELRRKWEERLGDSGAAPEN